MIMHVFPASIFNVMYRYVMNYMEFLTTNIHASLSLSLSLSL